MNHRVVAARSSVYFLCVAAAGKAGIMKYPNLFTPIKIGGVLLRNRICLAPMSFTYYSPDGSFTDENIAFVEAIAKGGTALINLGETIVGDQGGRSHDSVMLIGKKDAWPRIHRAAEAAHRHGAAISVEVSHGGMLADPKYNGGANPIGPGPIPPFLQDHPETLLMSGSAELIRYSNVMAMDEKLMSSVAETFADSVEQLKNLGFDMVQLHFGHGWLMHQFLSPLFNRREDKYGGCIENRVRFPLMVLERIRDRVGDFPLDARISGDDVIDGGNTIDDTTMIAALLEPYLDVISVSCGGIYHPQAVQRMSPHIWYPRGVNVYLAERIKKTVSIPVNTVGGISDPAMMEDIIAAGRADLVALGRALIADHELANKARAGKDDEINACLLCNSCQTGMFGTPGRRIHCAVNPLVGVEYFYSGKPGKCVTRKKILVIGGGPAGMEAALTAADTGHSVTLVEKQNTLGGALRFSDHVDFKADVRLFKDRMISRVLSHPNIEVILNTCADAGTVTDGRYDAVICAVGAEPAIPPVRELAEHSDKVFPGKSIYGREAGLGKKTVIIGGGLVGCETAVYLAKLGIETTVVEMLPEVAAEAPGGYRLGLMGQMEEKVNCITKAGCKEITDTGVVIEFDGEERVVPADSVIVAAGMRPLHGKVAELSAVSPVFMQVGDCRKPGKILEAVRDGYFAALGINEE